ncbi:alpha/beta fold hydrolase [Parasphingorhabdus cellanae]|uniref:Alpha/beta hydrolase n=1 Tax=Parasphingorhabdus cellanae TaxID=2806553 RepID=A0ABX7T869_9SPHN|nr:alpha/beta hydrolase [Parasphingorhabdus cellanae]QTD57281.1 alpha/beta hydrolase [Parasphingorhabdus cellanae]
MEDKEFVDDNTTALAVPTAKKLEARYATSPSQFIQIDGVRMHYRDEGTGPTLILLPGHLGNLRMYDRWAKELKKNFRVIRLDWPPYGLSIPDPSGQYGTDRGTELVKAFMDKMSISSAHMIGTSNGATVAAHIAALYPERVNRLAVSTLPLGPPPPRELSPELQEQITLYLGNKNYRPASFYREILKGIFADPANVTDEVVTMYTDMNNNPGGYAAVDEYVRTNLEMYKTKPLLELYADVKAPVLVQWGDSGVVLPPEFAQQAVDAFANAPVTLIRYPKSGHMPMLEQPKLTVKDLVAFLNGELDNDARQPK